MNRIPSLSVVIPVRNGARSIRACIEGILHQTMPVREIVVVDSGSTDGTREILEGYSDVRVIGIDPSEFNHGESRNLGARATTGDWIAFTVQDARPADATWLEKLVEGIVDEEVVGVCGSQVVPHERDKNPVEWFRPTSEPRMTRVQFSSAEEFDRCSPTAKLEACGWDNVTALYRRDVLFAIAFRPVTFGEDALWAKDAMRSGHALVYNPGARVYHYHDMAPDFAFERTLATLNLRFRLAGHMYDEPSLILPLARAISALVREPTISWGERYYWVRHFWRSRVAARAAARQFRETVAAGAGSLDGAR